MPHQVDRPKGKPPRLVITGPGDTPGQRKHQVRIERDKDGVKRMVIEKGAPN